jgi:hypothetical protein
MQTDHRTLAIRMPTNRSRLTNKPRKMVIDGRSPLGRRVRDLAEFYAVKLGGWRVITDMQAAAIRRAAELAALAEQARTEALQNATVNPDQLIRLENLARRAERVLGLNLVGAAPKPATITEYVASRAEVTQDAPSDEEAS